MKNVSQFRPLKKGKNLVKSGRTFIKGVSKEANFIDEEIVQRVFVSMVRYIVTTLRRDGVIRLPNFGDFWIVFHKEQIFNQPKHLGGAKILMPRYRRVKFECSKQLKAYFKMLDGGKMYGTDAREINHETGQEN